MRFIQVKAVNGHLALVNLEHVTRIEVWNPDRDKHEKAPRDCAVIAFAEGPASKGLMYTLSSLRDEIIPKIGEIS